ncbi:MAG: hypothetical protein MUC50_18140 [Myxococcota bacterium]|nr:hypothetical protein [Myxococcota bacterium]
MTKRNIDCVAMKELGSKRVYEQLDGMTLDEGEQVKPCHSTYNGTSILRSLRPRQPRLISLYVNCHGLTLGASDQNDSQLSMKVPGHSPSFTSVVESKDSIQALASHALAVRKARGHVCG